MQEDFPGFTRRVYCITVSSKEDALQRERMTCQRLAHPATPRSPACTFTPQHSEHMLAQSEWKDFQQCFRLDTRQTGLKAHDMRDASADRYSCCKKRPIQNPASGPLHVLRCQSLLNTSTALCLETSPYGWLSKLWSLFGSLL